MPEALTFGQEIPNKNEPLLVPAVMLAQGKKLRNQDPSHSIPEMQPDIFYYVSIKDTED